MAKGQIPIDDNGKPVLALWNDANGTVIPVHIGSTITGADGLTYAKLDMNPSLYNGSTYDLQTGNQDNIAIVASTTFSANGNSGNQINYNARGVKVYLATGAFGTGATAITVTIQGLDPFTNTFYNILTSASLSASSFTVLTVYPGIAVTANVSASDILPRRWRVTYQASAWGTGGSVLGITCGYNV